MKVVILCGGFGTRIRDVADDIPKPMIPIGGLPILWHIMKYYAKWGHREFILCLGYKAQIVKDFFLNYEAHTRDFTICLGDSKEALYHNVHDEKGWRITFADTGQKTMTGARIKRVQRYLEGDENFMLTYGDGVSNIDLGELIQFHKLHGNILTASGVRPPSHFGEIVADSAGKVLVFNEKPQAVDGLISGGFFICRREIFNYLNESEDLTFEQEPMRKMAQDGEMRVYRHSGFWHPMDTYRDYSYLHDLYSRGEAPWKVW